MGMGSILGGLVSGLAGKKIPFKHSHYFLLGTPLLLIPVILILLFQAPGKMIYAVLLTSVMIGMGFAALFTIAAQTFIQKSTPVHMLGKVGAFVSTICVCALPVGQAMYGGLFELFFGSPWVVVLVGTVISMMLAYAAKRTLRNAEA